MSNFFRKHVPTLSTAFVFVLLFTAASLSFENFFSPFVVADLFSENAFLGIAALGMTLVILSGGIDLSVGAVIGFTTILVASLITEHELSPWLVWATAIAIGTLFGAAMGAVIHYCQLPAFLVTLAGLFFARGMAFCVSKGSVPIRNETHEWLSGFAIPFGEAEIGATTILFGAMLLTMISIASATAFGRNVYAIGGDETSAVLMGVPVKRTKILVYAVNGLCASVAGIAMTMYMDSGSPINASALELDTIAVVVIGGTLLSGGRGSFLGTLLGFLIYGTIYQITFFANLGASVATIAIGALLLTFILMQQWLAVRGVRRDSSQD